MIYKHIISMEVMTRGSGGGVHWGEYIVGVGVGVGVGRTIVTGGGKSTRCEKKTSIRERKVGRSGGAHLLWGRGRLGG